MTGTSLHCTSGTSLQTGWGWEHLSTGCCLHTVLVTCHREEVDMGERQEMVDMGERQEMVDMGQRQVMVDMGERQEMVDG